MTLALLGSALGGCVHLRQARLAADEVPTLVGPAVRDNRTPMDGPLACLAGQIAASRGRPAVIAVGDVRDYTGKYSVNEGNAITQGGALMVSSALGKLGGAVVMAERFDPVIAERELGYTDRRQLGDGTVHEAAGAGGGAKVPWLPYYGGSIAASDYYVVGGITELNYDIRSGGVDVGVSQLGPKARTYTQSVAIDLRIVDTHSLLVVRTVSLTKQFTGYEVGFNLFQFFGSKLFDINVGAKGQEPLQLGIRTALEEATLRLVAAVSRVDASPCLLLSPGAARLSVQAPPSTTADTGTARPATAQSAAINAVVDSSAGKANEVALSFDFSSAALTESDAATIKRVVELSAVSDVALILLSRDTEALDPGKRAALTDMRIAAVIAALRGAGTHRTIATSWRADPGAAPVPGAGTGYQVIARLRITR